MKNLIKILVLSTYITLFLIRDSIVLAESQNIPQIKDTIQALLNYAGIAKNNGDYEKTLLLIERSHQLRKKIYPDTSVEIINSYINMAKAHLSINEYKIAIQYLHYAEKLCSGYEKGRAEEIVTICTLFGRIYQQMGNYLEAQQYTKRAEEILMEDRSLNKIRIVYHYMNSAALERNLGNTDASLKYYEKCFKIIQKLEQNTSLLLNYYTGVALTYAKAGNYNKSIELQQNAIKLALLDSNENAFKLVILYNNIGLDYLEMHELEKAENSLDNSLKICYKLGIQGTFLSEVNESIGTLWFYRGNLEKALEFYQNALKIIAPQMPADKKLINPEIGQIEAALPALKILKSKSNCLKEIYFKEQKIEYLDAAINTSIVAIELIERMRNSYQSYESKLQIAKHEYQIFTIALDLLHIAYQHTQNNKYSRLAFMVSEKSKSSVLLSVLSELDARQFGDIPDSLLEKENNLSRLISFYKEKLYEENQSIQPDSVKISTWEKYLFEAQRKYSNLISYIENNFPKYYSLKYDYSVSDIKRIQKILPGRTSLIEYSISDSILFTFVISRSDFKMFNKKIDKQFYTQLNTYLNKFHHFDFSRQSLNDFTEFCWASQSLYNTLIAPIYESISGNSLIIVPDGILSYLPFETLIKKMPQDIPLSQYRHLDYLIREFSVSYSYSATLFDQVNKKQKILAAKKLLAFAPEYSENTEELITKKLFKTRQNFRKNLFPIPGAIEEVETIHKMIPGQVFIGESATERNFKDKAGLYDILHLAMHTVIDNKNPLYSKLIFTLNNDSSQDGMLNTYEIFDLSLHARMIVLSACSTGGGEFNNGEGVISLARGFVYAGSPSIIMTMWEVEDKSGSDLMKYFYSNLLKGQSKTKALRNAKLACIEESKPENTHPFFWSSFVIMGNSQALYVNKYVYIVPAAASGILLILLIIWLRRRRNKEQRT